MSVRHCTEVNVRLSVVGTEGTEGGCLGTWIKGPRLSGPRLGSFEFVLCSWSLSCMCASAFWFPSFCKECSFKSLFQNMAAASATVEKSGNMDLPEADKVKNSEPEDKTAESKEKDLLTTPPATKRLRRLGPMDSDVTFIGFGGETEVCRLLRSGRKAMLQNKSTGEYLLIDGFQDLLEADATLRVSVDDGEEPEVIERPLMHVFDMHLQREGERMNIVTKHGSITMHLEDLEQAKDTVALSVDLPGHNSKWDMEVYVWHKPRGLCQSSVSFLLRWCVDCLGGAARRNFIGFSAKAWRNLLAKYYSPLVPEEGIDAKAAAQEDIVESSWSQKFKELSQKQGESDSQAQDSQAQDSQAQDSQTSLGEETRELEQQDWFCSPFAMMVLLLEWCTRGPRANSSWVLSDPDMRSRARAMLKGLFVVFCELSWQQKGSAEKDGHEFVFQFRKVEGEVLVDVKALARSCKCAQRFFGSDRAEMELVELLMLLRKADSYNGSSPERRQAFTALQSFIFVCVTNMIEGSLRTKTWTCTKVEQLSQLRWASLQFLKL